MYIQLSKFNYNLDCTQGDYTTVSFWPKSYWKTHFLVYFYRPTLCSGVPKLTNMRYGWIFDYAWAYVVNYMRIFWYRTVFLAKILSAIYSQWENRKRADQPQCVSYLTLSKIFDPFHHYPVAKHVEFMHNTEQWTSYIQDAFLSRLNVILSEEQKRSNGLYRAQV